MKQNGGQILIESIVGISIAVIALSGILVLTTDAFRINRNVGERTVAVYLAGEGVEIVKNMIDTNYAECEFWNDGLSDGTYQVQYDSGSLDAYNGGDLNYNSGQGIYQHASGQASKYSRSVEITNFDHDGDGADDEIQVLSTVTWEQAGGGTQNVTVEDHFFNWRLDSQIDCN